MLSCCRRLVPVLVLLSVSVSACQNGPTMPTPPPVAHPVSPDRLPAPAPPSSIALEPLTVAFTGVPSGLVVGVGSMFVARADHVSGTARYTWTVDGQTDATTDPALHVTFAARGDHEIRVTANDDRGVPVSVTTFVTVLAAPPSPAPPNIPAPPPPPPPAPTPDPVPDFTIAVTCTPGISTVCNLTATLRNTGIVTDHLTMVTWSWGDGSVTPTGAIPFATHTYPVVGTFTLVATATYDATHSATTSTTVTVK